MVLGVGFGSGGGGGRGVARLPSYLSKKIRPVKTSTQRTNPSPFFSESTKLPDIFSVLILDDKCCSFEWHARTVQETRTKVMPHKREVQTRLYTRASQVNSERRTIGDLQIQNVKWY